MLYYVYSFFSQSAALFLGSFVTFSQKKDSCLLTAVCNADFRASFGVLLPSRLCLFLSPDLFRYFLDQTEFCKLLFLGQFVADFAGGKAALRA